MARILIALALLVSMTGCMDISPLSPELRNEIDNQNGQIDDIKNNQNGLMLDLMKLRNEQSVHARDIENMQQGIFNKSNNNDGIQILQGDGALVMVLAIAVIAMILIYHYRMQSLRKAKTAEILAQQVALYNDTTLDNEIFLSAMNTDVEEEVYRVMVNSQNLSGRRTVG